MTIARLLPLVPLLALTGLAQERPAANRAGEVFDRLYRFDFAGATRAADAEVAAHPAEPFPYALRAAVLLFGELDRLMILEAEFFEDDKRIIEKKKLKPDPDVRRRFDQTTAKAHALARGRSDAGALLAASMCYGMQTDYLSLIEKQHMKALSIAKKSQSAAVELLRRYPDHYDAYLTTGLTEYLLGSLPFFVRWFVRFEAAEGSKDKAVRDLNQVAAKGRYLGPFARILLAIVHTREKRPQEALRELRAFLERYPENPLVRKETLKIEERIRLAH